MCSRRLRPNFFMLAGSTATRSTRGRSREGRFLLLIERELTRQLGAPSFTQKLLIRRLARGLLRLELLDEKALAGMTPRCLRRGLCFSLRIVNRRG